MVALQADDLEGAGITTHPLHQQRVDPTRVRATVCVVAEEDHTTGRVPVVSNDEPHGGFELLSAPVDVADGVGE